MHRGDDIGHGRVGRQSSRLPRERSRGYARHMVRLLIRLAVFLGLAALALLVAALLVACGPTAPGGITSAPTLAPAPQLTSGPTTVVAATDVLITYH